MAKRKLADDAAAFSPGSNTLNSRSRNEANMKQSNMSDFVSKKRLAPKSSTSSTINEVAQKRSRISETPKREGSIKNASTSTKSTSISNPVGTTPPSTQHHLQISENTGDLFAAPPTTLLIHACNTQGSWGAGIAAAFRVHYPLAYARYHSFCLAQKRLGVDLSGTALLIPPLDGGGRKRKSHFIGCLFTSRGKGMTKDTPARILQNTEPAMRDLLKAVDKWNQKDGSSGDGTKGEDCESGKVHVGEVWMCKINSGLFGVPWKETVDVLEAIEVDEETSVTVMEKE